MAHGLALAGDGERATQRQSKASFVGALSLYLSFISLFFSRFRIFGNRR